jgi:multicomponent Na+:H+ antiporter subunit E
MKTKRSLPGVLTLTAILAGIWYLLSGKFDLLHFGTGVATSLVIAWTLAPVDDGRAMRGLRFLFVYVPWLLGQILISNLRVARVVLSPRMPISPAFLAQKPGVEGARALTTLGCSVTLTPGTLTIDVNESELFVHALDAASAQDIRDQVMARRVAGIFPPEGGR